ncbi:MAG TPA: RNA polymerase sigma-70 factor [Bacteroidales bacterium]|nr:RNA polymerase sigma-70 factor [Bacteroidales bacterium]
MVNLFPDDNELVKKLRKGDVEAFDTVYEKYAGKLYSFGLKYLRSPEDAEELVQSVFLKLWENYKNLKTQTSFNSFLFTIAYNNICKLLRTKMYRKKYVEEIIAESTDISTKDEQRIDYQSVLNQVHQIVKMLPERQRTIFIKSRYEGKSTKEISEEIGLSPGTIDNYISKSLVFIRSRLKRESLAVILLFSLLFYCV